MGISTTTAARIYDGQTRGKSGEENVLSWEKFPYTALSKTYNTNAQVPDSAGTATAFASGVKTDAGEKFIIFICSFEKTLIQTLFCQLSSTLINYHATLVLV